MRNKIPADAFDYYRDLGPTRTYAAVAQKFGVSVRGITKRAIKEAWQTRLQRIEEGARRKQDEKAVEDAAAVDERHLKMSRAIQSRALEALRSMPLHSGMAAVRALDAGIKIERAILGRGKDGEAGTRYSHAALTAAAGAVPKEVVDAMLEAGRRAMAARGASPSWHTPPALPPPAAIEPPPPAVVPRLWSAEN